MGTATLARVDAYQCLLCFARSKRRRMRRRAGLNLIRTHAEARRLDTGWQVPLIAKERLGVMRKAE